jgi:hypothetical protein
MEWAGVVKGAAVGFLGYAVPMALVKRRLTPEIMRAAAAVAAFAGCYRLLVQRAPEQRPACAGLATLAGCAVDPSFASPLFTFWLATKGLRVLLPEVSTSLVPIATLMAASAYAIPTGYKHPGEVHPSYQRFLEAWVLPMGVSLADWRDPPGPGMILSDGGALIVQIVLNLTFVSSPKRVHVLVSPDSGDSRLLSAGGQIQRAAVRGSGGFAVA